MPVAPESRKTNKRHKAILEALAGRYGAAFRRAVFEGERLSPIAIILVNGRNVHFTGGLDTPLAPDDQVSIFPMVAGG